MTLAIIISPYNAPTPEARAANVRLGIALARWAAAQGYTPVGWWDMIDINDPPDDADPNVRLPALKRDGERARMVGAAGGVAVRPVWIARTGGMRLDSEAFEAGGGRELVYASKADLAPYLPPEPVPTVPREAVRAAVDEINKRREPWRKNIVYTYTDEVLDDMMLAIRNHTGVTPSGVPS